MTPDGLVRRDSTGGHPISRKGSWLDFDVRKQRNASSLFLVDGCGHTFANLVHDRRQHGGFAFYR